MYEEWFRKLESLSKNLVKCPVCKSRLGYRNNQNIFVEHCDDCKATYTYNPGKNRPTVIMDNCSKGKHCDCGRCE